MTGSKTVLGECRHVWDGTDPDTNFSKTRKLMNVNFKILKTCGTIPDFSPVVSQ